MRRSSGAQHELGRMEGIFAAPEGAATLAALEKLVRSKWVDPDERIVLFNTGSGLKYLDHTGEPEKPPQSNFPAPKQREIRSAAWWSPLRNFFPLNGEGARLCARIFGSVGAT